MSAHKEGADLFCGAGGTSTGMLLAARDLGVDLSLLAINHWSVAINSHTLNHPGVRHRCASLDIIRPRAVVPGGHLHIMAASPECTGHTDAAGGLPKNDQSRATAWHICRWLSELTVDNVFIENVEEFLEWGPLDSEGFPIEARKGETFEAFLNAIRSMGYNVEYRLQCAADFGDPTSRERLIILARRDGRPIRWPEPNYGPGRRPYRTARQIIDWDLKGRSIFNRKKPLCKNTLRRIEVGLRQFGGEQVQPFLVKLYGTGTVASIDAPLPTVTAGGNHLALVEVVQPFITKYYGTATAAGIDEPLDTVTTKDRFALVEPCLTDGGTIDILFRLLQPHELQRAMSFPAAYKFYGTRQQQVKQIGNAVPVQLARAHAVTLLQDE